MKLRNSIYAYVLLAIYSIVLIHGIVPHHHHDEEVYIVSQHSHTHDDSHGHHHHGESDNSEQTKNIHNEYSQERHNDETHCHFNINPLRVDLTTSFIAILTTLYFDINLKRENVKKSNIFLLAKIERLQLKTPSLRGPPSHSQIL